MDSMFENSVFVNTVQKGASFCPGNFPLPLPKLQVSDKCEPRDGGEGSGAPEGNLVAMLTPKEAGEGTLLPWSGQVQSSPFRREGRTELPTQPLEGVHMHSCLTGVWFAAESLRKTTWLTHLPGLPGTARQRYTGSAKVRGKKCSFSLFRAFCSSLTQSETTGVHHSVTQCRQFLPPGVPAEWRQAGKKKEKATSERYSSHHTLHLTTSPGPCQCPLLPRTEESITYPKMLQNSTITR